MRERPQIALTVADIIELEAMDPHRQMSHAGLDRLMDDLGVGVPTVVGNEINFGWDWRDPTNHEARCQRDREREIALKVHRHHMGTKEAMSGLLSDTRNERDTWRTRFYWAFGFSVWLGGSTLVSMFIAWMS